MIPEEWKQAVLSGEVQLVDPPKPESVDPYSTPEYQAFVEEMAKACKCCACLRPCDGCLAGGLCDQMICARCNNEPGDYKEEDDE